MTVIFYGSIFALSVLCSAIFICLWRKHFDANFILIFTLAPIACLGYVLRSLSVNLEEMLLAVKMIYIGGCFLPFFYLFSIANLSRIEISRWIRVLLFCVCGILYASVLTIGFADFFYTDASLDFSGTEPVLTRSYGFMHTVFYAAVIFLFAAGLAEIAYAWRRKKEAPRTILAMLFIPEVISVLSFFLVKFVPIPVEIVPLGYVLAQIMYLIIASRVSLYNAGDTVVASMVREKEIGYISLDFNYRYLGSNEAAKLLVPELSQHAADDVLGYGPGEKKVRHYLDSFREDPANTSFDFFLHGGDGDPEHDRFYKADVNYLFDGIRNRGYIVTFTDNTEDQKYIRLLDTYNEKLESEVELKTRHIVEMHDNLIMSLAMMVESRDNSTGGHIKRTSEGVRILVDEIRKEGRIPLTDGFCRDMIKAAPMHDLGKIAVEDAVLKKPGKFIDEEFAKMKRHAAEGARVIHEILLHTDDESFKTVAENVAHYHHERWDGSGYPEKLRGEEIPVEARIMAVADVYDALVSRRVYKEAFNFAKADSIILEGMGSQFDPGLKGAYEKARPRLEEYYRSQEQGT